MKGIAWLLGLLALSSPVQALPDSFAPIVKAEGDKVVHISTTSTVQAPPMDPFFERFLGPMPKERKANALGSGFIFQADGLIVTNNHVVEKAEKIQVTLKDGKSYEAKVVGKDPITDLALIKIEVKGLSPVRFGDSEALEVGDWVLAIGNPMGLDHTVTAGIISAKGRDIFGGAAYGQFLQTDAAINPGNSGGPLFNMKGEVVGINTAIAQGQGLGFAVPANLAIKILEQLQSHGEVKRGWLGVGIQDVNEELAQSFGLPSGSVGVVLTMISEDGPAAKAGLQQGDVVTEVNGKSVQKTTELQQAIAETAPGGEVRLKVYRAGKLLEKKVKVVLRPAEDELAMGNGSDGYGMELVEITPKLQRQYGLAVEQGLYVAALDPAGVAFEKGLREGDIITKVNGKPIASVAELQKLSRSKGKGSLTLLVQRGNSALFLALPRLP